MVFMLEIVLRAFRWIFERIVGLQDSIELATITGVLIIGMIALSKIAKNALYRSRVGVRADFQDFVTVDEVRGFHHTQRSTVRVIRLTIEFRRATTAASANPMPRLQEIANGEKQANKHHERD